MNTASVNESDNKFIVYLTNLQASKGRIDSLQAISKSLEVDVVIANETNLKKYDKFHLGDYKSFTRNKSSFGALEDAGGS